MKIYTGEITGPYHIQKGEGSQDSYNYYSDNELTIIVVADGAGSLINSKMGSQFVVDQVIQVVRSMYNSSVQLTVELISEITAELILNFKDLDDYKTMGCTVSYAVIDNDTLEYGIGIIGDAFAVVHHENGEHTLIINEQVGEYSNITELISSDKINDLAIIGTGFKGISVSSDGLVHSTIKNNEPLKGFWDSIMNRVENETLDLNNFFEFMNSRELIDDDTTLVVAVRE